MHKSLATGKFAVDEELAWEWLMRAIAAHEMGMQYPTKMDLPPIGSELQPREIGEEDATFLLIRGAQEAGVLHTPTRAELDFEFIDDGDGGYYRYLLRVDEPTRLVLASDPEEMRHLGEPDTTGIDAALVILREAADAGNLLHRQLSSFITAAIAQHRAASSR